MDLVQLVGHLNNLVRFFGLPVTRPILLLHHAFELVQEVGQDAHGALVQGLEVVDKCRGGVLAGLGALGPGELELVVHIQILE